VETKLTGADINGANLNAVFSGSVVSGGGISGTPAALPPDWTLTAGYLIGPSDNLTNAMSSGALLLAVSVAGLKPR